MVEVASLKRRCFLQDNQMAFWFFILSRTILTHSVVGEPIYLDLQEIPRFWNLKVVRSELNIYTSQFPCNWNNMCQMHLLCTVPCLNAKSVNNLIVQATINGNITTKSFSTFLCYICRAEIDMLQDQLKALEKRKPLLIHHRNKLRYGQ